MDFIKTIFNSRIDLFSGLMDSPMTSSNSCGGVIAHQTSQCSYTNPRASRLSGFEQMISRSQGMRHSLEAWTGLEKEGGQAPGMATLQPGCGGGSARVPPGTSSQVRGPRHTSFASRSDQAGRDRETPQRELDLPKCPVHEARAAGTACGSPGPAGREPSGAGLVTSPWPAPRS